MASLVHLMPGPWGQRAFAIASFGIALGSAVLSRRDRGGLAQLDLAASIAAWTCFHFGVSKCFARLLGHAKNVAGFAPWAAWTSLVNGLVVQPLLLALAVRNFHRVDERRESWQSVDAFLRMSWHDGSITWPLEQALCCTLGYVLREFRIARSASLYPDGLELPYALHHLICAVGAAHNFFAPVGAGLLAVNGIQCEVTSALFSLREEFPNPATLLVYRTTMAASGLLGFYLTHVFWHYPASLSFRLAYVALVVLLGGIRTGGLVVDLQAHGLWPSAAQLRPKGAKRA